MSEPINDGSLSVEDFRGRIDAIDQVISSLLLQRADASRQIQDARVRSGGARVDLAREREVISTYVTSLGQPGTDVAHSVLALSRGRVDAVPSEPERQEVPSTS